MLLYTRAYTIYYIMCIYTCIHMFRCTKHIIIYVLVHTHIYIYIIICFVHPCICKQVFITMHICLYANECMFMYECMCVFVCLCIIICIHTQTYTRAHTHFLLFISFQSFFSIVSKCFSFSLLFLFLFLFHFS